MSATTDKLAEVQENTKGTIERLVSLTLEAEVDHKAGDALRDEIKKWVDAIKADSLIHFSLHMIGTGYKFVHELKEKLGEVGNDIDPDKKIKLQEAADQSDERVQNIARLALEAERSAQTSEDLREEIKKWIDAAEDETLGHFSTHMIGTGVVFSNFVNQKLNDIPNA